MFTDLLRLEAQGFSRASTAIALRSVATCPNLFFQPLSRPVIGVALLSVVPEAGGTFHFHAQATALRHGALPAMLADWIEPRLPATGPLISWETDARSSPSCAVLWMWRGTPGLPRSSPILASGCACSHAC